MTVIDLHSFKPTSAPLETVLCLGNFDGVHIGHQALISQTVEQKNRLSDTHPNIKSGVGFFRRAPHELITGKTSAHLTVLEDKLLIFSRLGLDVAFIYDYSDIGNLSPEQFVTDVLKKECGCIFAVCGYNFRFGRGASGDAELLSKLTNGNAYTVEQIKLDGMSVSSSAIRKLISSGDIEKANAMLGRPYSIRAVVLHGKKLGRRLGIPTVNQSFSSELAIPEKGIYISQTYIDGVPFKSVSNVGIRPSVEDGAGINCETHILGFEGDLYGCELTVEFLKRLREEIKFDSIDALTNQIKKDIEQPKEYFNKK